MTVRVALAQFSGHIDKNINIEKAESLARQAAGNGAKVVCFPELCTTIYFCFDRDKKWFETAEPVPGPAVDRLRRVAKETGTVIVYPLYENDGGVLYNTAVVIGPDGELIGKYRKMSIPQILRTVKAGETPGDERFFFEPGNLGFPVFDTPFGLKIGILICYDRHFPEAARVLGLGGAEILFVPTATTRMTRYLWDVELRAHAIANVFYVCGVNKVGVDVGGSRRDHHGNSMILSPKGEVMAEASATEDDIALADLDLATLPSLRKLWGYYRDRRPDKYAPVVEEPSGRIDPAVARPVAAR